MFIFLMVAFLLFMLIYMNYLNAQYQLFFNPDSMYHQMVQVIYEEGIYIFFIIIAVIILGKFIRKRSKIGLYAVSSIATAFILHSLYKEAINILM